MSAKPLSAVPLTTELANLILATGVINVHTSQGTVVLSVPDLLALLRHRPAPRDDNQQVLPQRSTSFSAAVGGCPPKVRA